MNIVYVAATSDYLKMEEADHAQTTSQDALV